MESLINLADFLGSLTEVKQSLNEAVRESDLYEPVPGASAPISTHEVKRVRLKGVKNKGKFFSKRSASDMQTFNEYLTWLIYKASGLRVAPKVDLVFSEDLGHLRLVQGTVSGRQVKGANVDPVSILRRSDIHKGVFVDSFLGNWDVIGNAPQFNVFVGDGGKVSRIDTGGMSFRAQGQMKGSGQFGDVVDELASWTGLTGSPRKSGKGYKVFSKMDEKQWRAAAKVFKRLTWPKVADALADGIMRMDDLAMNLPPEEGKKLFKAANDYYKKHRPILKKRHEYLMNIIKETSL